MKGDIVMKAYEENQTDDQVEKLFAVIFKLREVETAMLSLPPPLMREILHFANLWKILYDGELSHRSGSTSTEN
jgi:hypothetical protein